MQEFSSVSVSSYEAGSLADQLNEQSRGGWSVVAIVPTGSTITAYLCRDTDGSSAAPVAVETAAEPTPEPAAESTPEADAGAGFAAIVPDPTPEPAEQAEASDYFPITTSADAGSTAETTTAGTTDATGIDTTSAGTTSADTTATDTGTSAGAAPAGWYADPSGRFELRYWDGGQWTEHVSRAGQQYTDPPVA